MSQLFHPSSNALSRLSILGAIILLTGTLIVLAQLSTGPYTTEVGVPREQPVPFSHEHHVAGLGIDCRYCHNTVEISRSAGMPATETCMSCHSQIWTNAEMLEPVRQSYRTGVPLKWTRVHDLPDFVYFNHSIHVAKGVGCETCHGRVDKMPLMWKQNTLQMQWCLDCHRNPEKYVRPRADVFTMGYMPAETQATLGPKLVKDYHINVGQITDCSTCHR